MEHLITYIPAGLVIAFLIGLSVKIKDQPTFDQVEETYRRISWCKVTHKAVDKELRCFIEMRDDIQKIDVKLGQIEVLMKMVLKNNGNFENKS